jgi:hypothetical protein
MMPRWCIIARQSKDEPKNAARGSQHLAPGAGTRTTCRTTTCGAPLCITVGQAYRIRGTCTRLGTSQYGPAHTVVRVASGACIRAGTCGVAYCRHRRAFRQTRQSYLTLPCSQPQQILHRRRRTPCGQGVHMPQLTRTIPCSHPTQFLQLRRNLPCIHGVQILQLFLARPCGQGRQALHLYWFLPCGHR